MTNARGPVALEIAVGSAAGSRTALAGGADRVELCSALELGGVTPSQALIEAVAGEELAVHVLIRPRPGDFVFDADELGLMQREIVTALAAGAAGVVIGALTDSGGVDIESMKKLIDVARAARPTAELTFHRAVDQTADPVTAATIIESLGMDRLLTSGGAPNVAAGLQVIGRMAAAAHALQIMAGGGLKPADIPELVSLGVAAVHLSAKRESRPRDSAWISLGSASQSSTHWLTDPDIVSAARGALDDPGARVRPR